MLGHDDLIPRPGEALGGELQHLVRAHAADDAVGVEAVDLGDGRAQAGVVGIGIAVHLDGRHGSQSPRALSEGP